MVAAGLGFAFHACEPGQHPGVVGLPVVEPEFWRQVGLVSVRGRRYSPRRRLACARGDAEEWFGKQPERAMDFEGALEPADIGETAAYAAE